MAGDEKPKQNKKQNLPAYRSRSRDIWVYFVMQIELKMQIRQGPQELGGAKQKSLDVASFPEQGTI